LAEIVLDFIYSANFLVFIMVLGGFDVIKAEDTCQQERTVMDVSFSVKRKIQYPKKEIGIFYYFHCYVLS
jgi:hypothetical protein